jgi:septal ring factor EnvC (AmiA/AmiB activator)
MSMPLGLSKEGNGAALVTAFGIVLAAMCPIVLFIYSSQSNEIAQHDRDIATLKIAVANSADAQRRTENSIATIDGNLTTILGALQGLKDANDAQTAASAAIKDRMLELQKGLGDLDLWLRPPRSNGH